MDETVLEICEYTEDGYKPLIDYGDWRVAILNYIDELRPDQNTQMERHMQTDEVFVLMRGRTILFLGGNDAKVDAITPEVMESGKLYNVKKGAWHSILMTRDASILLVENRDTDDENSEYFHMTAEMHNQVLGIAKAHQID